MTPFDPSNSAAPDAGSNMAAHAATDASAKPAHCAKRAEGIDRNNSTSRYVMTSAGLYAVTGEKKHRVCSAFEVVGRVRDPEGVDWGRLLQWHDEDGRMHQHFVSDASLHGDLSCLLADLARNGLVIETTRNARNSLASYLNQVTMDQRITQVRHTGWHVVADKPVFVLPGGSIGTAADEKVILVSGGSSNYDVQGSLESWRNSVGVLTADHQRLVLMCSVAFAGPLLHLTEQESAGIHLYGNSRTGKTTSLAAAASVWGKGASPGFILPWRQTANAFEAIAAQHTDTLLILDEVGAADSRVLATSAYQLTAGSGKGRLNRDASLKRRVEWRSMLVSTGELPVAAKIAEGTGRTAHAGQQVRVLDIPADAGAGFGVFNHPGPNSDASMLSDAIKRAAVENYGTAGPAFVGKILEHGPEEVTRIVDELTQAFVGEQTTAEADGQVRRAARRFGLIAAAGELAQRWGVVPWRSSCAGNGVARAYSDWLAARGGADSAESLAQIALVRRFIEEFGESQFDPMPPAVDVRPVQRRAGWRREQGNHREWLVLPEIWKEICGGFDATGVARLLASRGMLRRDSNKLQRSERTPYGTKRVYVLTAAILDEDPGARCEPTEVG